MANWEWAGFGMVSLSNYDNREGPRECCIEIENAFSSDTPSPKRNLSLAARSLCSPSQASHPLGCSLGQGDEVSWIRFQRDEVPLALLEDHTQLAKQAADKTAIYSYIKGDTL